ncbi:MAG TPA: aspartate 1-decarboxylase [Fimbriiglobus sp.]|jgi:aspartate 1-decarboxylase
MRRTVLKSKIHRATVTAADLDYEGSLTLDADLLDAADILPNEQIHIWDVTNGNRIVTYALEGERGSGVVQVNGGGAHKIRTGDVVIIATFTAMGTRRAKKYRPRVVFADAQNRPRRVPESDPPPAAMAEPVDPAPPAKPPRRKKG